MDSQIVSSALLVLGTLGAALGTSWINANTQRDAKKMDRLERKVEKYRKDIIARMEVEDAAAKWLFESHIAPSEKSAFLELRERAKSKCGLRPTVHPSDVEQPDS